MPIAEGFSAQERKQRIDSGDRHGGLVLHALGSMVKYAY